MEHTAARLTILGSGSSGNCAYVETPQARFLVDAGFSGREIERRLGLIGRTLNDVEAILLTHEHSDHVIGLPALANKLNIPVYANRLTSEHLKNKMPKFDQWHLFRTGETFDIKNIHVRTFAIPHDAYDPVGYAFEVGGETIGFVTDLGYATNVVMDQVSDCSVLVLEANHDVEMLRRDTKRPWAVKQRILARHGHLSNEASAKVASFAATKRLKHLYLSHLSSDCNTLEMARAAVNAEWNKIGINHVSLYDTWQDKPTETLALS